MYIVEMYIEAVTNRNSPPCVPLRESYRDGKRVRKRAITNLTHCSPEFIEALRMLLKGGTTVKDVTEVRSPEEPDLPSQALRRF